MSSGVLHENANQMAAKSPPRTEPEGTSLRDVLLALASLKFTVTLFAFTIVLVFAGTLAQVEKDIWQVIDEYFRTAITWIDLQLFFPPSFFPNPPQINGGFYFPGGWLLGALLTVNLLAAHGVRFKVQARGRRLAVGLSLMGLGALLAILTVIISARHDGLRQSEWLGWPELWRVFQASIGVLSASVWYAGWNTSRSFVAKRRLLITAAAVLATWLIWSVYQGDSGRLDNASMRILWQLGKGAFAALVMLTGCTMVFKQRAGIVLLHGGIGIMMLGELLVGLTAVEGRMRIREGETVNYVYDIRSFELAVVDKSQPNRHEVVSVPESMLREGQIIRHEFLPFDVRVIQYLDNAILRTAGPQQPNPATAGIGLQWVAESSRPVSATNGSGDINKPAAYVQLLDKDTADELGIHLVGLALTLADLSDKVEVDGATYHLYFRFKRTYKPYALTLLDVRKDDYPGTNTPRHYASEVRLIDDSRNVDRKARIWMNNPLRFAGETFYQSGYFRNPETGFESTTLSVVNNGSWMLPYVACMMVAAGMLAHFGGVLSRFLNRGVDERAAAEQMAAYCIRRSDRTSNRFAGVAARWFPLAVTASLAAWIILKTLPPDYSAGEMQIEEFGNLPVIYQGRAKPLDTLARNSLRVLSDRQTFVDGQGDRRPAVTWLLDLIGRPEIEPSHRVFRIENSEVLDLLGLDRRSGLRYAFAELIPRVDEVRKQADLARTIDPVALSVFHKKILELDYKLAVHDLLVQSFVVPETGPDDEKADAQEVDLHATLIQQQSLAQQFPPLCIPPRDRGGHWQAYSTAWLQEQLRTPSRTVGRNPATATMTAIFHAYSTGDAESFNRELDRFSTLVKARPLAELNLAKTNFEANFNRAAPFYHAAMLYVIAFVLTALSWLVWSEPLRRSAFWLISFTLVVHTIALAGRIYISGRPPVTNLYSSAVFIGWGCVALGVVFERIFRIGVGNVIASVAGFATLLIAHLLSGDGDTFAVLEAVLDTQFWLATHVVCITLGYTTTLTAGLLGALYILRGTLTQSLSLESGRQLARMIYGTLCFATIFSFIGTVLGGLWADDSWGRFWGWDPKENGALIIVLWNALVLHARWGGMARPRGLAVLAVGGNIAVGWSWFGVNELGVGLHSYGFTEGVLRALGLFVASQLIIIAIGLVPQKAWRSQRGHQLAVAANNYIK